jgi:4-azaleucine resistance transporter AzlC
MNQTPLSTTVSTSTPKSEFIAGLKATIPLDVGAIPFGIIFGALAVTSGLSPLAAIGMSALVFAGSSQFIGITLVAGGAGLPLIWLTTFIVNVRHALYSASLAPYARNLSQRWLVPLGFWLTDETYLVTISHYENSDPSPYKHYFWLASSIFMYLNWQLCTIIGVVAGSAIENPARWGLDFAMSATFIGMIVPTLKNRPMVLAALVAAVVAVVAHNLPNQLWLILAAIAGVIAGVIAERVWGQPEPETLTATAKTEAELEIEATNS